MNLRNLLWLSALVFVTPTQAAMLTADGGGQGNQFGGSLCADVRGASLATPTALQIWGCHGAGNQQFNWNERNIYAMGTTRCVERQFANGGLVNVNTCDPNNQNQWWRYIDGHIRTWTGNFCLITASGAFGTQLSVTNCTTGGGINFWQIK